MRVISHSLKEATGGRLDIADLDISIDTLETVWKIGE